MNIQASILVKNPNADRSMIAELAEFIEKLNIKWTASPEFAGAYFIMSDLAVAKGLDKEDYRKHWSSEAQSTTAEKRLSLESLAGKACKFEKEKLANFKQVYLEQHGIPLGKINSLWVGDWTHAYSYLVQGKTQVATEAQSLGAKSIEQLVKQEIKQIVTPVQNSSSFSPIDEQTERNLKILWDNENALASDLVWVSSFGPYKLDNNRSYLNFHNSKINTRRPDFVHFQPHKSKKAVIDCYELKKDVITLSNLEATLNKCYIELLQRDHKTQYVRLIMVAPLGGTSEAHAKALDLDNVEIWTAMQFTLFLLDKAKKYHQFDQWFLPNLMKEDPSIRRLLTNPALIGGSNNVAFLPQRQNKLHAA